MPEIYNEKDKSVIVNMFDYVPSVKTNAEIHQHYPGRPIKGKLLEGQARHASLHNPHLAYKIIFVTSRYNSWCKIGIF